MTDENESIFRRSPASSISTSSALSQQPRHAAMKSLYLNVLHSSKQAGPSDAQSILAASLPRIGGLCLDLELSSQGSEPYFERRW